ncbi:MAG TPA: chemotaxis protein [Gallionella sp.]|nr:chemotaxis protein [Gallionella sp.]
MIYVYTVGFVLFMMVAWVVVQAVANRFAHHHPEFGPAREMGVGGCCGKCSEGTCDKDGH